MYKLCPMCDVMVMIDDYVDEQDCCKYCVDKGEEYGIL